MIIIVVLKFVLPLLIFKWPFQVSWLNFILDSVDGDILTPLGLDQASYQLLDKLADFLTYIVLFLVGRKWAIGKTITILFLVRAIGQLLYLGTQNELFLFFFPNFLEPLFLVYSLLLYFKKDKAYTVYRRYLLLIWIGIVLFKMWNEVNIHVLNRDLSDAYLYWL